MKPSSISQALKHLLICQRPVFLWGPPGVGKSDIVAQVAKSLKVELKDVRLSLMDPVDIRGFPTPSTIGTKKVMSWLPPDFLPTKGKGVLFLDEMNAAPASVMAAAYQLILNRKIGDYTLPDGWNVIAAGNRTTDRAVVHAMPSALANRFVHIDFTPDMDDWMDWAIKHNISSDTRGYIRFRPANLFTEKIEPGARAFPTPRSWVFADQIIKAEMPQDITYDLLKGTIGEGVAVEFIGFLKEAANLPSIDQILLAPDKVEVPKSVSTKHALISALETQTTPTNLERLMKYVKRMDKEFEVVFLTSAMRHNDALKSTKFFIDWTRENRSILLGT